MKGEREAVTMARGKSVKKKLRSQDDEGPRKTQEPRDLDSFLSW